MNYKRIIIRIIAVIMLFAFTSTNIFADINLGNQDGTGFQSGTSNNYWGVYTDSGTPLYDTEGLRVTVYDAETNTKVFNTIDIAGNPNISAVSNMCYFVNCGELIPKTSWLNQVGGIYDSIVESDMIKFNNKVTSMMESSGYNVQYVPQLASIDIVSINNTSHLEQIKDLLSDREFLKALCSLIGCGLTYTDIAAGKYKIAFEPVAYLRYNGQNWALSATECGLLNKYMKNYFTAAWNSTNNLRALLGPLTHSNLPRSAFLETRDLGISVYSPSSADYYNGNAKYNSDSCIIRCMGIGVLSTSKEEADDITGSVTVAAYHTDTDVYTSFDVVNIGETTYAGDLTFGIYDDNGDTPKIADKLKDEKVVVKITNGESGPAFTYAYPSDDVITKCAKEDDEITVFVDNPRYSEDVYGIQPYKLLGYYKNGDIISVSTDYDSAAVSYSVTTKSGAIITEGKVDITCPAEESSMGWFKWHTPSRAQDVIITLTAPNDELLLVDENGVQCSTIVIEASVEEIKENTPPDPKVTDTRPSWQKIYNAASVEEKIAQYTATTNANKLSWYTWTLNAAGWTQTSRVKSSNSYTIVTNGIQNEYSIYPYLGAKTEKEVIELIQYGVDNRYYANAEATRKTGNFIEGAVYISTNNLKLEKKTYTVSVSADVTISPSDHCPTAKYNNASSTYTMKSGYGIQIEVNAHISGDTQYCTGSQTANVLFPEFNYNLHESTQYNRLLEKINGSFVFKTNEYSTYNDRVHFTPIWFPDRKNYTVYVEVFDVWCPAGQLSVRLTDNIYIKGNVYDDWHVAPVSLG